MAERTGWSPAPTEFADICKRYRVDQPALEEELETAATIFLNDVGDLDAVICDKATLRQAQKPIGRARQILLEPGIRARILVFGSGIDLGPERRGEDILERDIAGPITQTRESLNAAVDALENALALMERAEWHDGQSGVKREMRTIKAARWLYDHWCLLPRVTANPTKYRGINERDQKITEDSHAVLFVSECMNLFCAITPKVVAEHILAPMTGLELARDLISIQGEPEWKTRPTRTGPTPTEKSGHVRGKKAAARRARTED